MALALAAPLCHFRKFLAKKKQKRRPEGVKGLPGCF